MHKAIFVKQACQQGAIGERQFIRLVGDRLTSFVEQLKLNESLFFQKFREEANWSATTRLTYEGVGRSSSNRRSACRQGANMGNFFPQTENMGSASRDGIAAVNWARVNIPNQSHGHRIHKNRT
ncbi:hypothetical protein SAMN04490196_2943 [Pseudomonas moraviensis]|nr:hypothetical protein SAMN04490196_2943 [Pseudomonas moraviensis]